MSKAHEIVKNGMSIAGFFRLFPTDDVAEDWFEKRRWPHGVTCPHCESGKVASVAARRPMPYRCRECRKHFSVTSGTVMHGSKLGAQTGSTRFVGHGVRFVWRERVCHAQRYRTRSR